MRPGTDPEADPAGAGGPALGTKRVERHPGDRPASAGIRLPMG